MKMMPCFIFCEQVNLIKREALWKIMADDLGNCLTFRPNEITFSALYIHQIHHLPGIVGFSDLLISFRFQLLKRVDEKNYSSGFHQKKRQARECIKIQTVLRDKTHMGSRWCSAHLLSSALIINQTSTESNRQGKSHLHMQP